jgi:hypothetical protein
LHREMAVDYLQGLITLPKLLEGKEAETLN